MPERSSQPPHTTHPNRNLCKHKTSSKHFRMCGLGNFVTEGRDSVTAGSPPQAFLTDLSQAPAQNVEAEISDAPSQDSTDGYAFSDCMFRCRLQLDGPQCSTFLLLSVAGSWGIAASILKASLSSHPEAPLWMLLGFWHKAGHRRQA